MIRWLQIARELQGLAQSGIAYSRDGFDIDRFRRVKGIAAEIVAEKTMLDTEPLLEDFTAQIGYATPKIDVRGAVVQDGDLLLVQEKSDQRWSLPGGWGDVDVAPGAMVAKEVWEESGLRVRATRLVGVYDTLPHTEPRGFYHCYKLLFLCEMVGGALSPGDETLAAAFFPFDALPPLSPVRTTLRHLVDIQAAWADPCRLTVFD